MPNIGVPQGLNKNPFAKIKMADKAQESARASQLGDDLNILAGRRPESTHKEGPHNQIGKDGFLKLLTHQLKNQDPINPMDQKQFAADLAQFSQLEQLTNMRTDVKKLHEITPDQRKSIAAGFLGKEISTRGTSVNYKGQGSKPELNFILEKPAMKVIVRILDSQGNTVAQIDRENMGQGYQSMIWDGVQLDKSYAAKGEYRIAVNAWDNGYNPVKAETRTHGLVTGVSFDNNETILHVKNRKVALRDIVSFREPEASKPARQAFNPNPVGLGISQAGKAKTPVQQQAQVLQNYGP